MAACIGLRVRTKPGFVYFLGLRREEPTQPKHQKWPSGSCASRDDTKNLASVNSEYYYLDRRCIARAPLLGRSKLHSSFFGQTDDLLTGCSVMCQLFRAGVVTSFRIHLLHIPKAYHSAVIKSHPTEGAEMYCCIQAGGIRATTKV